MPDSHPQVRRVRDAAARHGVELDVHVFPEGTHTAQDAAAAVGAEVGQIVKSLVFVAPADDGRVVPYLVLASGANRVDIAQLAALVGEPRLRRANAREAADTTGFVIGGIPPFGHTRQIRVVMDPDLERYETVWAAAGTQTAVFPITPATLRSLSGATVAPVAVAAETAGRQSSTTSPA